jgi:hypothetical protein
LRGFLIVGLAVSLALILLAPNVFAWELERPSKHFTIDDRQDSSGTDATDYGDGKGSVGLGIHVEEYTENMLDYPSDGDDDVLKLRVVATGNTRKIIRYGMVRDDSKYYWHDNLRYRLFMGDDEAQSLDLISLQVTVRFFGGGGSAEYSHVWVDSNGLKSSMIQKPQRLFQLVLLLSPSEIIRRTQTAS